MPYRDQTDLGGKGEAFLTTHWSLVEHIQAEHGDRALIGALLARYWKPVYCYLRHKGYGNEEAKDLTQGFFHEVVLSRNLVQRADRSKGRFRTFLLHALNQHLINEQRRQTRQKRTPKGTLVPLEIVTAPPVPEEVCTSSPEDAYTYAWLAALLDQIVSEVEAACRADGMETHWLLFRDRVVRPILTDSEAPSLAEICATYGVADERKASNMITTVKRRLQKALTQYLRNTASSDKEIREEFAELARFFPRDAQDNA